MQVLLHRDKKKGKEKFFSRICIFTEKSRLVKSEGLANDESKIRWAFRIFELLRKF